MTLIKNHLTMIAFVLITALIMITVFAISVRKVDCNDPHTWSTPAGVEACAITEEN